MTVDVSIIHLLDGASGEGVEAELRDAIEAQQIVDWQMQWQPALLAVLQELARRGVPPHRWPQGWHWNWKRKAAEVEGLLAFRGFCVTVEGVTQGLMRLDLTKTAREPSQVGKPLVYVDYLEVAPWNRPDLAQTPRFRGLGTALLTAAVAVSDDEGFKGRMGLHSLPQADDFYRRWNMTEVGPDPAYQNLTYFELTPEQARAFLEEEE